MHCFSHSLSLAFQDSVSAVPQCRDAMNQIKDLINFVSESPKRLAWFKEFQDSDSNPMLRPLCPTRWTMRISSIVIVVANYSELLLFLEDMSNSEKGDLGSKSCGFLKQLQTFSTFFALKLLIIGFSKFESTAHSLQSPKLSLTQAQSMIDVLSVVLNTARDEQKFNEMWAAVVQEAGTIGAEEPILPRRIRRPPRRLDEGTQPHLDASCEDLYRRIYFSVVDADVTCLKSRFQSPAFNFARDMEATVIRAISSDDTLNLNVICKHFGDDLNESRLKLYLSMLRDVCHASAITATCMNDVVHLF